MKTICVQIGNSDDKLSQAQWSEFVELVSVVVSDHAHQVHFFGGSSNWTKWQNAAWVFDCEEDRIESLKEKLIVKRKVYLQDSVGYLEGKTEFL